MARDYQYSLFNKLRRIGGSVGDRRMLSFMSFLPDYSERIANYDDRGERARFLSPPQQKYYSISDNVSNVVYHITHETL